MEAAAVWQMRHLVGKFHACKLESDANAAIVFNFGLLQCYRNRQSLPGRDTFTLLEGGGAAIDHGLQVLTDGTSPRKGDDRIDGHGLGMRNQTLHNTFQNVEWQRHHSFYFRAHPHTLLAGE